MIAMCPLSGDINFDYWLRWYLPTLSPVVTLFTFYGIKYLVGTYFETM